MGRRGAAPPWTEHQGRQRILIISASMGAGHDGAARNLAAQLRADGHTAEVKDFLTSGPLRIGAGLRRGYEFELKHVPSAYDATYRLWYRAPWLCPAVAWIVTLLTRRRVLRWIDELGAQVVVSTYPLATLCLGRLRSSRRLRIPAVNFITDFGVHPLWVHRGMDLNLAIHELPAEVAARRTGRHTVACGPAVSDRFDSDRLPSRDEARTRVGLGPDEKAVLVVAGSWGVGNVRTTWDAITRDGRFVPVVVCGRDERLREHVSELAGRDGSGPGSRVIGWTDDMPSLMAACDALVENAGGLTSLEAMCAGLPVVSFDPIAGHGKENTAAMHAAGVACLAPDANALGAALAEVTSPGPGRSAQVARAHAMFRRPPAELVLGAAAAPPVPVPVRRRRTQVAVRLAAAAAAVTAVGWAGLTTGVAMATEAGAGVAHPAKGYDGVAYVGVRLTGAQLADGSVDTELRTMGLTAVIDAATAQADPNAVRSLVAQGVSVANGGGGDQTNRTDHDSDLPWSRARLDARASRQLSQVIDQPVTLTIPGRRLTAWDLVDCRHAHTSLVVPNHILRADRISGDDKIRLVPRDIYLVNGLQATPGELVSYLAQLRASLSAAGISAVPLATLS